MNCMLLNRDHNRKSVALPGFSLAEFILYLGIATTVILVATDVVFRLMATKNKQESLEEVTQNGRIAFERIMLSIRNASSVTIPAKGTTSSILGLTWNGVSTTYSLSGGILLLKEGTQATTTLTTPDVTIQALEFRNVSATGAPAIIRVRIGVSSTNPSGDPDVTGGQEYVGTATVRSKP